MASLYMTFAFEILLVALAFPYALASQLRQRGGAGWSNAYWVSQQDLTAATQVQCPSWAPINCNAIQEPDYCCPSGNYCAYAADKQVGCCPWGQTCTGNIGGGGGVVQQSSWVAPTTTYWQQPSTVYVTNQPTTTIVYAAGQATQQQPTTQQTVYNGQYCSTLYAHGDNLPTTQPGTCGTILIANEAGSGFYVSRGVLMGAVLLVLGSFVFQLRIWA